LCSGKDDKTIEIIDLERKLKAKKLLENMHECINQYVELNVLYLSNNKKEITLL